MFDIEWGENVFPKVVLKIQTGGTLDKDTNPIHRCAILELRSGLVRKWPSQHVFDVSREVIKSDWPAKFGQAVVLERIPKTSWYE